MAPSRLATALVALIGESCGAALAPEYALALELDDACISGGPSCSLALAQLRASSRHSSFLPGDDLETIDTDLGFLGSAEMTRESLESDTPPLKPAVLHSELPWAATASHEAEQTEGFPGPAELDQPLLTANEEALGYDVQRYESPAMHTATQGEQKEIRAKSASNWHDALRKERAGKKEAKRSKRAGMDAEEEEIGENNADHAELRKERAAMKGKSTPEEIGEDDSHDADWKKESAALKELEHVATAAEHGRDVQDEAEASNKVQLDGAEASLAKFHHGHTGHSTIPKSRGEAHNAQGGAEKHADSQDPEEAGAKASTEASYTKTFGGYEDVVLAGPADTDAHFTDLS